VRLVRAAGVPGGLRRRRKFAATTTDQRHGHPSTTVNLYATKRQRVARESDATTITAVVNNSTNQSVTWAVTGGAANGSIDSNGLYTAPALVPNPAAVTVKGNSGGGYE